MQGEHLGHDAEGACSGHRVFAALAVADRISACALDGNARASAKLSRKFGTRRGGPKGARRHKGNPMDLTFYGATGTVTGSKYLVDDGDEPFLVDCGLFQGFKQIRQRNWQSLPFSPKAPRAVVLSHAHIDHSGYLPILVKSGFTGPIYCTRATADLCAIMLPDAAHLQEEEARYANKRGFSKHKPALPLFDAEDAQKTLAQLVPVDFERDIKLTAATRAILRPSGHILGAAMILLQRGAKRLLFSGDLGRNNDPVMHAPAIMDHADYLVLESTYGDRRHPEQDPEVELARHLERALARDGVVIIPAFAVGRAQIILHLLARLRKKGRLSGVPIYLNSPMAVDATRIYHTYREQHRLTVEECKEACGVAEFVNSPEASKALNARKGPMIIIAASGMATGGRVVHHLKAFVSDAKNLILFSGFQAGGTRGATMLAGSEYIRIHGQDIPVRAEVANLEALSAHADYTEILSWLRAFARPPTTTFLTHGEPKACDELRQKVERELGWECYVPDYRETVMLP